MKLWPFKVVAGENGMPNIVVQHKGEEQSFFAEDISAMVLVELKNMASIFIGKEVKKAVVTVPAYFTNSQRQATKRAGELAGLEVIQVLNEPTAAALAYAFDNRQDGHTSGKKRILVFDLGGGTFDVSLLDLVGRNELVVIAVDGDTHLGGQDLDNRMVQHLVEIFQRKHNKDISENKKSIRKLKAACERAKRQLSANLNIDIHIDALCGDIDFSTKLTRAKFVQLNEDVFQKCIGIVDKCLRDASVERSSIDEVVLVGGCTRIPRIQELLRSFFDGKELCCSLNQDEVVAVGASIQAAILNKNIHSEAVVTLHDVAPFSVGIMVNGDPVKEMIGRETPIPCSKECTFRTAGEDYETVLVFECGCEAAEWNVLVGQMEVPATGTGVRIKVILEMDANGILKAQARNEDDGATREIVFYHEHRARENEILRMVREERLDELEFVKSRRMNDVLEILLTMLESKLTLPADKNATLEERLELIKSKVNTLSIEGSSSSGSILSTEDESRSELESLTSRLRRFIENLTSAFAGSHSVTEEQLFNEAMSIISALEYIMGKQKMHPGSSSQTVGRASSGVSFGDLMRYGGRMLWQFISQSLKLFSRRVIHGLPNLGEKLASLMYKLLNVCFYFTMQLTGLPLLSIGYGDTGM